MRSLSGLFSLLSLSCLLLISVPLTRAPADEVAMDIQADEVHLNLDQETTQATGQARLTYRDVTLYADRILANRTTGDVEASGRLSLEQKGRRLEGDSLKYNFQSESGVLQNARVREQGVIIRGQSIEFSPQSLVARHAYFTTCDAPQPDYSLAADEISLTAAQAAPGKQPQSGRLTLDRARVVYHGRRLLALPRYSVAIGQIGQQGTSPFPATGFDREDGPYATISYSLGRPGNPTTLGFSYRYTTFRGIRGYAGLQRETGPLQLSAGYVRREASTDRDLQPDDFTTGLANVMVNREPEIRALAPSLPLRRSLSLRAELSAGSYSESEHFESDIRARANRVMVSALLAIAPHKIAPTLSLSHAIGWRESSYSTGQDFSIRFLRHSLEYTPSGPSRVALSYITRRGSGATPFLFDRVEVGRELLADVRFRLNPRWHVRFASLYDLERHDTRDMMLAVTRTIHCLDYTVGWRKARGALFVGVNITPPSGEGRHHDRTGATPPGNRVPSLGEH